MIDLSVLALPSTEFKSFQNGEKVFCRPFYLPTKELNILDALKNVSVYVHASRVMGRKNPSAARVCSDVVHPSESGRSKVQIQVVKL